MLYLAITKNYLYDGVARMDDRDWLILKSLYIHNNISKTAQSLYISQPALTKRIKQIEKEFQVPIIERGTRGVRFTAEGEYLAKCADEMIERIRQMKETVWNMNQEVVGTIRLGVSNFFAKNMLPKILRLFKDRYPRVDYKVITGLSSEVFNLVYNKKVHFGIVRGEFAWAESKCFLFEENICVASKEKIELEQLPKLPRIEYKTDASLKRLIDDWWSGKFSQPPLIEIEVDSTDTCKEMVRNGLGYGLLPSVLLKEDEGITRFTIKDENDEPIIRKTWMIYHNETIKLKTAKEFVRFIENYTFD